MAIVEDERDEENLRERREEESRQREQTVRQKKTTNTAEDPKHNQEDFSLRVEKLSILIFSICMSSYTSKMIFSGGFAKLGWL